MIDTIILEIITNLSSVIDNSRFHPSTRVLETIKGFLKCRNNATAEEIKKRIYRPKLTMMKRGPMIILKVEFSAPKILWKNNLDEIEEKDFNEMVIELQNNVREMGVTLQIPQIENAKVIGFHPSKNIVLTNGYTSSFTLKELSKISLSQKMDIEKVSFRNGGEAIQFYANRHSAVFYDKINDLNKPSKRAIDKDQTKYQEELFEFIKKERKSLEVLRFEPRLSKSDKMKEILEQVGFIEEPLLKNIFKRDLCQKIVKFYWEKLFGSNLFLFNTYNNPQKILEMILTRYPKTKIRTAVMFVGLNLLCKDDDGIRGFRNIAGNYGNYKNKTNWLALKKYIKKFDDEFFTRSIHGFVKDIQEAIDKFEAFKLDKKG